MLNTDQYILVTRRNSFYVLFDHYNGIEWYIQYDPLQYTILDKKASMNNYNKNVIVEVLVNIILILTYVCMFVNARQYIHLHPELSSSLHYKEHCCAWCAYFTFLSHHNLTTKYWSQLVIIEQ